MRFARSDGAATGLPRDRKQACCAERTHRSARRPDNVGPQHRATGADRRPCPVRPSRVGRVRRAVAEVIHSKFVSDERRRGKRRRLHFWRARPRSATTLRGPTVSSPSRQRSRSDSRRAFDRHPRELLVVFARQAADANRADPPAVLEDGDAAEEEGEEGVESSLARRDRRVPSRRVAVSTSRRCARPCTPCAARSAACPAPRRPSSPPRPARRARRRRTPTPGRPVRHHVVHDRPGPGQIAWRDTRARRRESSRRLALGRRGSDVLTELVFVSGLPSTHGRLVAAPRAEREPVAPRTGAPSSTGSITRRSRRRFARLMPRTAGPTHRSSQSVLAGPERRGGGPFPGRILVSDHRDHRGERDQRP
jgi:hypothetical protein